MAYSGAIPSILKRAIQLVGGARVATLTGAETIDRSASQIQILNPNGSNRTITLPTTDLCDGWMVLWKNSGTSGNLIIATAAPVTVATLTPGQWAITVGTGTSFSVAAYSGETGSLDLNGTELILDADADTSITADTDDQIDFRLSGADDFRMIANYLLILSGSAVHLADSAPIELGNTQGAADDSIAHNGTNTVWTHSTGNLLIDNTAATGATLLDLGTDTSATSVQIRNNSGTAILTVAGDSTLASAGALTTTDGVSSGTARKVGGVASIITAAGTSHTGSTDEAVLASYVIPANTIKAGTFVRCRFLARVTADNGATTLTGRLRLGTTTLTGTELIVSSAVDTSSGHIFEGEFVLIGRAAPGASAAIVGCGSFAQPAAAGGARITANLNSTNFATNGALLLELTADWSAADANAVQAEIFVVEVIG